MKALVNFFLKVKNIIKVLFSSHIPVGYFIYALGWTHRTAEAIVLQFVI